MNECSHSVSGCFSLSPVFPLSSTSMRRDEIMQTGNEEAAENPSHPTTLPHLRCPGAERPVHSMQLAGLRGPQSEGWPLSEKFSWHVFCRALHRPLSSHPSAAGRLQGHNSFLPPLVVSSLVCDSEDPQALSAPPSSVLVHVIFSCTLQWKF